MRILQVIVNLERGDAIGNFTLMLKDVLKQEGYETSIYANRIGDNVNDDDTYDFSTLRDVNYDDCIIYQMCESNSINRVIEKLNCRKIAIYHNVTPPKFFNKWATYMKDIQTNALEDIKSMNKVFDYCIADSDYNKKDLIHMGYDEEKISVLPIITDLSDYRQEPDKTIVDKYNDGYTNFLFVGRIVPNKKQEDLIRAFAYYKKNINSKSRLILVGSPFSEDYYQDLVKYVVGLKIDDVLITGRVPFKSILAYYSIADVFLCMSEHEGFCVPLLEAMMFKVPIIAYDASAVPETLGNGGIIINDKNPVLVSYIMHEVAMNQTLRKDMINAGTKQLEKFAKKNVEMMYINEIKKIIEG